MPSSLSVGATKTFERVSKKLTILSGGAVEVAPGATVVVEDGGVFQIADSASNPATCEVGQLNSSGGKLYICSAANTWTLVGSQT
jgi:hypothetical protein